MLRIYFMQQWFDYSETEMEEALHDIPLLRGSSGLDAGVDIIPDETMILNFRHLLERFGLGLDYQSAASTVFGFSCSQSNVPKTDSTGLVVLICCQFCTG